MNDFLLELKTQHDELAQQYFAERSDELLDEMNRISAIITRLQLVDKISSGNTQAIIENSKVERLRYRHLSKARNASTLDYEIEAKALEHRSNEIDDIYRFIDVDTLLLDVAQSRVSISKAKKYIELKNLKEEREILDRLEEMGNKMRNNATF